MAFLLPVVFSPSVNAVYWTPGMAVLALAAGVGIPLLVVDRSAPARAALVFVAVAAVSALLAHDPTIAVFGLYGWGTGLIFLLALGGAWAIGHALGRGAVPLISGALLAAALVNAVVAIVQSLTDLTAFELGLYGGRADGMLGNPVHLGALSAAAIALVAPRVSRAPAWAVAAVVLGAAVQLSGSRAGFGAAVAVLAWAAYRYRRAAIVLVCGVVLGVALGAFVAAVGGGVEGTVTSRVQGSGGGGGISIRLHEWSAGLDAFSEHPVLGWGPSHFRTATSPRRTVSVAQAEGSDVLYTDAHNMIVEALTTTGLLGAIALLSWLALTARRGGGPLLVFGLAILATQLFEPQWIRTTPIAYLALGLSACTAERGRALGRLVWVAAPSLCAALAFGSVLLVGDFHLDQGRLDFDRAHADRALSLLPSWPEPATLEARIHLFRERVTRNPDETEEALRWRQRAIERDDRNPALWNALAEDQLAGGLVRPAIATYQQALRLDPVSARALTGLSTAWMMDGRRDEALTAVRRSLAIRPDQPAARRLLATLTR